MAFLKWLREFHRELLDVVHWYRHEVLADHAPGTNECEAGRGAGIDR